MSTKSRIQKLERAAGSEREVRSCVGIVGMEECEKDYRAYQEKWAGRRAPYPFIWIKFNRELPPDATLRQNRPPSTTSKDVEPCA